MHGGEGLRGPPDQKSFSIRLCFGRALLTRSASANNERKASEMSLTPTEIKTVQDAMHLLSGLLPMAGSGPDTTGAPSPSPAPSRSLKWEEEMMRCWRFLRAVDKAGGSLLPKEISVIARASGYDPRAINGYYRGDGCLRRAGNRRELTDVGRALIAEAKAHFGQEEPS